jgi:sarcosine oxidase gamma subunit
MRPVGLALTMLLALSAALAVPARGLGANANAVTTSRYLHANQTFVRARAGDLTAALTAAQALVAQVRAECPAVLSGAPDEGNVWASGELDDAVQVAFARARQLATVARWCANGA